MYSLKMKLRFIAPIFIFVLSSSTQAMPQKPEICPSTNSIIAGGLSKEYLENNDGSWVAFSVGNQYDTKEIWDFGISGVKAKNKKEAYAKAKAGLRSLVFKKGPYEAPIFHAWACDYTSAEGYLAFAFMGESNGSIARFIHGLR